MKTRISHLAIVLLIATLAAPAGKAGVRYIWGATGGDMHIVAVGIDRYDDPTLGRLRFARADAEAFARALASGCRGFFDNVHTTLLLDERATRQTILDALEQVVQQVGPKDTFVFLFAGQGQMIFHRDRNRLGGPPNVGRSRRDEFVLMPSDGNTKSLEETAIPGHLLQSVLRRIQARNRLVVLDSGGSSAGFESAASIAIERDEVLADALDASVLLLGADGMVSEGKHFGEHGFITRVLLDGLSGLADINNDKVVTSRELEACFYGRSFELFRETKHAHPNAYPYPRAISRGKEFPLVRTQGVDRRGPDIKILEPASRGVARIADSKTATVRGTASDESGIASVLVDGQPATLAASGEFSATVTLKPGENVVRVEAEDRKGNMQATELTIRNDAPGERKRRGRDYAVLFATNDYQAKEKWPQLNNAVLDATKIQEHLLGTYGFAKAEVYANKPLKEIVAILEGLKESEWFTEPDDQLFIFFAGHGFSQNGDGFIVATDSPAEVDWRATGYLPISLLQQILERMKCQHIFLSLDACNAGTIFDQNIDARESARSRGALDASLLAWSGAPGGFALPFVRDESSTSLDEFVLDLMRSKSRVLMTPSGDEAVSDGKAGEHSPFAKRFIAALEKRGGDDGVLTTREIYDYVLRQGGTRPRRGPFTKDAPGDFVFVAKSPPGK
jgi:uncharacterized caspase-like protein